MQLVVPAPVNELVPQDKAVTVGSTVEAVPLRLIDVDFEAEPWVAVSVTV